MKYNIKNICCIGAGYVGGPTMSVFAKHCPDIQFNVVDINTERINKWNSQNLKELPIYEPGLDTLIKKCRGKNLHFSTQVEAKIADADMIFISVNTPTKVSGFGAGKASDLKWIDKSSRQISKYGKSGAIVVEKSTLPVKTAQTIEEILNSNNNNKVFKILSNPEFLAEGSAINNLEFPDRVLIGGDDNEAINALIEIYSNWIEIDKILTTDLWSSELSKLISNAFLAQRISSINSISALCEKTGANIKEVSLAVGSDKRIGEYFLEAGPGFGGSCFKKDISNLVYISNYYGLKETASYWQKVIDINNWQSNRISQIIVNTLFGTVSGKRICILGFAFKSNTNDIRESPAISICRDLLEEGALLQIYDPRVEKQKINQELSKFKNHKDKSNGDKYWIILNSIKEATQNCDAIIVITEWNEFKDIVWSEIAPSMRHPSWVFDTRSIIDVKKAKKHGVNVWSVGNGSTNNK